LPCHIFGISRIVRRSQRVTQWGGKWHAPCGPTSWPRGGAHLPLVRPFIKILVSMDSAWHKIDYIKDPWAISQQGSGERQNTPNGCADCEDRRRDATGAAPDCPFDYIDTISFSNMMKRE
jgi:hypothetical protein